jgi:hypothetical protein
MPLEYSVEQPFELPQKAFDESGVARVNFAGGSYGGSWVFWAWAMQDGLTDEQKAVGKMSTERAPGKSKEANESVLDWVTKACESNGLRVDVISSYGDEFSAEVILAVARQDAPVSEEEPEAAEVEAGRVKRSLLERMGWA